MSEMKLTSQNFEELVLKADKPVLVDFFATWCMPCKMVAPIIEEIAEDVEGKAYVGKIDVDEAEDIAAKYSVSSIPTLIVFENGKEVRRTMGAQDKDALMQFFGV